MNSFKNTQTILGVVLYESNKLVKYNFKNSVSGNKQLCCIGNIFQTINIITNLLYLFMEKLHLYFIYVIILTYTCDVSPCSTLSEPHLHYKLENLIYKKIVSCLVKFGQSNRSSPSVNYDF